MNAITGNTISRDASSGRFYVIKNSDFEGDNVKDVLPEGDVKMSASTKRSEGGFTIIEVKKKVGKN